MIPFLLSGIVLSVFGELASESAKEKESPFGLIAAGILKMSGEFTLFVGLVMLAKFAWNW